MAIDQGLIQQGLAGGQAQPLQGLFASQQAGLEKGQDPRSNLFKKVFPGLFKPSEREQELLDIQQEATTKQFEQAQQNIAGELRTQGLGDAMAFPAVRAAIESAAAGDPSGEQAIEAIKFQSPAKRAGRELEMQKALQAQEKFDRFGFSTPEAHTDRTLKIGNLQTGRENVADLQTLSKEFGREVLPGRARGAYKAIRGQVLDTLRQQFEAGALQKEELKFFQTFIPEFDAWNTLTQGERDVMLSELSRQFGLRQKNLSAVTKNAKFNPEVTGRGLEQILGGPALGEGFEEGLGEVGPPRPQDPNPVFNLFPGLSSDPPQLTPEQEAEAARAGASVGARPF